MIDETFITAVKENLGKLLEGYGFSLLEAKESGFNDDCELVYSAGDRLISLTRDRGDLMMFCGFDIQGSHRLWPIESALKYFSNARPKEIEIDGVLSAVHL